MFIHMFECSEWIVYGQRVLCQHFKVSVWLSFTLRSCTSNIQFLFSFRVSAPFVFSGGGIILNGILTNNFTGFWIELKINWISFKMAPTRRSRRLLNAEPIIESSSDEDFEVEKILGKRIIRGQVSAIFIEWKIVRIIAIIIMIFIWLSFGRFNISWNSKAIRIRKIFGNRSKVWIAAKRSVNSNGKTQINGPAVHVAIKWLNSLNTKISLENGLLRAR